jgi:cell division protein FtsB
MNKVTKKIKKTQEKIAALYEEIDKLQEECKHETAIRFARSDTGNYSKADDRYWYDCSCPVCLKIWTEDQ